MKKIFLIFTVLTLMGTASKGLAQKVVSNQKIGNVTYLAVIDNGTLLKAAIKTPSELSSQKTNARMKRHLHSGEINKKLSYRFAVAKNDLPSFMTWAEAAGWNTSANNNGHTTATTTATTGCPTYSEGSDDLGSWRLPTQRELMLIYQMRSELEAVNGFTNFMSLYYWSSTERGSNYSWSVSFSSGTVNNSNRSDGGRVRCVRDL